MTASILVVDDDASTCSLLRRVLTRQGYAVTTVADGEAALAAIATERPGLVVTDLLMPGLDGVALIDYLREHDPLLPIVVVTAAVAVPDLGSIPVLLKPFSLVTLLATVQQLLPDAE